MSDSSKRVTEAVCAHPGCGLLIKNHAHTNIYATPAASEMADAAWLAMLDCTDETHGDSWALEIAAHRPLIEAALSRSTPTPPEPRLAVDSLNSTNPSTPTPDAHEHIPVVVGMGVPPYCRDCGVWMPDATDAGSREVAIRQVLTDWGLDVPTADPPHGWRCQYPSLSDPLTCGHVDELVRDLLAAAPSTPTTEGLPVLQDVYDGLPHDADDEMYELADGIFQHLHLWGYARLGERP